MSDGARDSCGADNNSSTIFESQGPDLTAPDGILSSALKQIEERQDRNDIVNALAKAILAQEMTRATVTNVKMTTGDLSSVDPNTIISDWRVLSRHYAIKKYEQVFDNGASELEKLTHEEAQNVLYEIRIAVESIVNTEMKRKAVRVALSVPIIGPILWANLSFTIIGTRFALRKFWGRIVRLLVLCSLWLSVLLVIIHWISLVVFNEPTFVLYFEGVAKPAHFLLLVSTTFVVWALLKIWDKRLPRERNKLAFVSLRLVVWLMVLSGWSNWFSWLIFGISSEITGLAEMEKLTMVFYLVAGSVGAWLFGRISGPDESTQ